MFLRKVAEGAQRMAINKEQTVCSTGFCCGMCVEVFDPLNTDLPGHVAFVCVPITIVIE
jgi:hypothetical protein